MAVEVKQWMAKDGTLFCDKHDAEEHERYVEKIEFIEKSLDVDFDKAVEIEALLHKHAIAIWLPGIQKDAVRYQALVKSGNFAPSPFDNGMWGLRSGGLPVSKPELDAAVDRAITARRTPAAGGRSCEVSVQQNTL